MLSTGSDLTVQRRRGWRLISLLALLVASVAMASWYAQHPTPLPTTERTMTANTPVGEPVYVGMANGFTDRTLRLSGVKVHATSATEVSIVPLLCVDGRIEVTTDAGPFCSELVNPEGRTLRPQDSIVLEIAADVPTVAMIDPVRLGFRENLQWGTMPTGAKAVVQILAR